MLRCCVFIYLSISCHIAYRTFTTAAEYKVQGSPNSIHFNPTYNNVEAVTCSYLVTASIRVGKYFINCNSKKLN